MVSIILAWLSSMIISVISSAGYGGVFFLMALESACVPIPSEVIMPFAGFLVWEGRFDLWPVVIWGTLGNLAGSILAYGAGLWGGRRLVEKYGKYVLISRHDLDLADSWFARYGQIVILASRMLPVVRTFISLPAGITRMPFKKFCVYTLLGCLPWSFALAYAGLVAGANWDFLKVYFHKFDLLIGALIILGAIWWVRRHVLSTEIKN